MNILYSVELTEPEREQLLALTRCGIAPVRRVKRANILLMSADNCGASARGARMAWVASLPRHQILELLNRALVGVHPESSVERDQGSQRESGGRRSRPESSDREGATLRHRGPMKAQTTFMAVAPSRTSGMKHASCHRCFADFT